LDRLYAIHVNDSKKPLGARVDRHADIGDGAIGLEGFKLLMNDKKLANVPKILETPVTTTLLQDYARNLERLKKLLSS
jgi:deoxyribonuclease-4